jgi:hypothetical protein
MSCRVGTWERSWEGLWLFDLMNAKVSAFDGRDWSWAWLCYVLTLTRDIPYLLGSRAL